MPLSNISIATIASDSFEFEIPTTTARLSADLIDLAIATERSGPGDIHAEPLMEQGLQFRSPRLIHVAVGPNLNRRGSAVAPGRDRGLAAAATDDG